QKAEQGLMWWIGDWWAFGEHRYGERTKQLADTKDREYKLQTLMDAGWVSRQIETSRRREVLSWSHHKEVAALEPAEQDALLAEAVDKGWSRRDIRKAARRAKALRIHREAEAFPTGKYRVIYADPPWSYSNEPQAGTTTPENYYPLLSIDE